MKRAVIKLKDINQLKYIKKICSATKLKSAMNILQDMVLQIKK